MTKTILLTILLTTFLMTTMMTQYVYSQTSENNNFPVIKPQVAVLQVAVPNDGSFVAFTFGGPGSVAGPFEFDCTLGGGCRITVTDAFLQGDQFEVFDFGASIGTTSAVAASGSCGTNPDVCLASPGASSGVFNVGEGAHSMTIVAIVSPFGSGGAFFKIDQIEDPVLKLLNEIQLELKEIWDAIIRIGDQVTNIEETVTNIEETVTAPALASFIDTETIDLDGHLSAGDFKLLMDITPFESVTGHVAMKVPCDKQGDTDLAILTGVAPAVTPLTMNFVGPLSDPGTSCLYHGDIGAGDTDVALINTGKNPVNFGPNEEGFSVTITIQGTE